MDKIKIIEGFISEEVINKWLKENKIKVKHISSTRGSAGHPIIYIIY